MHEQTIWTETPSMKDFFVNPVHLALTFFTWGGWCAVIWLFRRSVRYELTDERLRVRSGILSKKEDEIELFRIRDTKVYQGPIGRLLGLGEISIRSTDDTGNLVLKHFPTPREKREQIRQFANLAKAKANIRTVIPESN